MSFHKKEKNENKILNSVEKKECIPSFVMCYISRGNVVKKGGDEIVVEMKEAFVYINEGPNISMDE